MRQNIKRQKAFYYVKARKLSAAQFSALSPHLPGGVEETSRTFPDTMYVLRAEILIRTLGIRRRIANSGEAFMFSANEERPIQTEGTLFTT